MEVNDEILHVELMYSADSVECYIGLVDTDRDSFSEFHSILYVGGWPSIKKANVQGYDYIFTITISIAYDITHWKDDDAYGNDNRLIDEKTYAKPFDKLVLYGTHIN